MTTIRGLTRRYRLACLSLAMLLGLISCDSTPQYGSALVEETEPDPILLIPLEVGNRWIYEVSAFLAGVDTVSITTTETFMDAGEQGLYFREERPFYFDGALSFTSVAYLRYTEQAMERVTLSEEGILSSRYRYYYPGGEPGRFFYEQEGPFGLTRFDFFTRIVSVDSVITTPTGRFSCLVYRTWRQDRQQGDRTDLWWEEYFAPGVGIVRRRSWASTTSVVVRDLVSFRVDDDPARP